MLLVQAHCPNCGAPLDVKGGQTHVICAYCDTSARVAPPPAAADTGPRSVQAVPTDEVSKELIQRVKELALDGKRDEAVRLYAEKAHITEPQAATAVDNLIVSHVLRMFRHMPINWVGALIATCLALLGVAGFAVSVSVSGEVAWVWAFISLTFAVYVLWWLAPKVVSRMVCSFGAKATARVVKCKVLRPGKGPSDGSIVLLLFEVRPDDGSAAFFDEEPVFLRTESIAKLATGNLVRVRYGSGRERVFPESPIQVIGVET